MPASRSVKQGEHEVKAGDLVTIKGSAGTDKDGTFAWRADIQVGTLGKIATVEDIAKLMLGAQQKKGGWGVGLDAGGDAGGGWNVGVTFSWSW